MGEGLSDTAVGFHKINVRPRNSGCMVGGCYLGMREFSLFQNVSNPSEFETGESHLKVGNWSSQVAYWFLSWERRGLVLEVI